jgi:hypothetical protein
MKKVFLGGTAGNNHWRDVFISSLLKDGIKEEQILSFQAKTWTNELQNKEERAKKIADYFFFYLGSPKQKGKIFSNYSMVEAVMALYDHLAKTVVVLDFAGMKNDQKKVLVQLVHILKKRFPKARIFSSLEEANAWLLLKLKK